MHVGLVKPRVLANPVCRAPDLSFPSGSEFDLPSEPVDKTVLVLYGVKR